MLNFIPFECIEGIIVLFFRGFCDFYRQPQLGCFEIKEGIPKLFAFLKVVAAFFERRFEALYSFRVVSNRKRGIGAPFFKLFLHKQKAALMISHKNCLQSVDFLNSIRVTCLCLVIIPNVYAEDNCRHFSVNSA